MKLKDLKKIIIYCIIILFLIISFIIYFVIKKTKNNNLNKDKTTENISSEENKIIDSSLPWEEDEAIPKENLVVKKAEDRFSYFLVKQCLEKYYESSESAFSLLDEEAKEVLQINENNFREIYGKINSPKFCIDKLYVEELKPSKDIYILHYRVEDDNNSCTDSRAIIKIDYKNVTFSIYPYEFVRKKEYSNIDEKSKVIINNLNDIEINQYNDFNIDKISKTDENMGIELFIRYQFDLKYDIEKAYRSLSETYRDKYFAKLEQFQQFVNDNNNYMLNDIVIQCKSNKDKDVFNFKIETSNGKEYTINSKVLTEYTISLKDYKEKNISTVKSQTSSMRANRYLENIRLAINSKDYGYVYEKLGTTVKNNYFKNLLDFEEYVHKSFFEHNSFEIIENTKLSENVYQLKIKITDTTKITAAFKINLFTITLLDYDDFSLGVKVKE